MFVHMLEDVIFSRSTHAEFPVTKTLEICSPIVCTTMDRRWINSYWLFRNWAPLKSHCIMSTYCYAFCMLSIRQQRVCRSVINVSV